MEGNSGDKINKNSNLPEGNSIIPQKTTRRKFLKLITVGTGGVIAGGIMSNLGGVSQLINPVRPKDTEPSPTPTPKPLQAKRQVGAVHTEVDDLVATKAPTGTISPTPTIEPTSQPLPSSEKIIKAQEKKVESELPEDILSKEKLDELKINLYSFSNYEPLLRESALKLPIVTRDLNNWQGNLEAELLPNGQIRTFQIESTSLNIVFMPGQSLNTDTINKISDPKVKEAIQRNNSRIVENPTFVKGKYFVDRERKEGDKIVAHYYILMFPEDTPFSKKFDDLPDAPEVVSRERKTNYSNEHIPLKIKTYGQWLSYVFRHEAAHFLSGTEWEVDKIAIEQMEQNQRNKEKGDTRDYSLIIRDKKTGEFICV